MKRSLLSVITAAFLVATLTCLSACSTKAPKESAVQSSLGMTSLSARRVRIASDHAGAGFMWTVEIAADSIIKSTDDSDVRRNALVWKANAIPALQSTTHHPDPLVSFIDGWTLMLMMQDYFESGRGRELFGEQQPIAVDAMRGAVQRVEANVRRVLEGRGEYQPFYDFVHDWAAENPLSNDLFLHRSVAVAAADILGEQRMGGLSSLGTMEEMALDAQTMARSYLAYTFKTVLWQTELMIESMMDTTLITPLLDSVDRMAITSAATRLLEATPGMIASERSLILAQTERMLEASLDRTLAMVAAERAVIMADVEAMIARERAVIFEELQAMTPELMGQVEDSAISVVDHVLLRLAIGAAVLVLLLGLGLMILRPRRGAPA